jgi:hypothetical protein
MQLNPTPARRRVRRAGTALLVAAVVVATAWLAGRPAAALTLLVGGAPAAVDQDDVGAFATDRNALDRFARIGVVRYDCTAREVHVRRAWWGAIDWEGKSNLVDRVQRVCGADGDGRRVTVLEMTTGGKLAVDVPGWFAALDR